MSDKTGEGAGESILERQCKKAAKVISKADVLVLMTGAGFSADSGLATYTDIAQVPAYQDLGLEYADICQMKYMREDPELFWGFWGSCFNDYRSTQPHEGYAIIQRWKKRLFEKSKVSKKIKRQLRKTTEDADADLSPYRLNSHAGGFFIFTSNVDAHSYDFFDPSEVYECHGNTEVYQCSGIDKDTLQRGTLCTRQLWRCPLEQEFTVNLTTMRAPRKKGTLVAESAGGDGSKETESAPAVGRTQGAARKDPLRFLPPVPEEVRPGFTENFPQCINCDKLARPAILMFDDSTWLEDNVKRARWKEWKKAVRIVAQRRDVKVAVLEIGAGQRVPTVRFNSSMLLDEFDADLIRINPDWPNADSTRHIPRTVSVPSRGLEAIKCIDRFLT